MKKYTTFYDSKVGLLKIEGTENAYLGMKVEKSGRTTEFSTGEITLLDATVRVNYGGNKIATFEDQIITGNMSAGGDSGSLLVSSENKKATGLPCSKIYASNWF